MQITRLRHPNLEIKEFSVQTGQFCCILGSIDSGIDQFLQLLEGNLSDFQADVVDLPEKPVIISFAVQQEIYEDEIRNDDSDFLDYPDPGTLARSFLPSESLNNPLIDQFDMRQSMDTGYRHLSSGQSRKLLLLKAILNGSSAIILDSPYDGLDPAACHELNSAFTKLPKPKLLILLLLRNIEDIPSWCDHLAFFHDGQLKMHGLLENIKMQVQEVTKNNPRITLSESTFHVPPPETETTASQLIHLKNGFGGYGDNILFSGLELAISKGDHTLVTGPNGCGKSTLLQIITGDNPKCYSNDLTILGVKRGSGESIWDIKKNMGIVSPEIHRNYRVPGSALHVVLSGLFDSIGLYQRPTAQQEKEARRLVAAIDMADLADTPFRQLPYGKQRLILIARSLIKEPPLLILDEPTQGLDSSSRRGLLDFLELMSEKNLTTILYVSHRKDEYRSFFKQHIKLEQYK